MFQPRGEPRRPDAFQQVHRRHVERQPQRCGRSHRAVEGGVEIGGPVAAERLRRVDQQAFRMDHPGVQRHAVQERLERGARRAPRLDHVDMAEAQLVAERHRSDIGARFQRGVIDHQQGCRRARRQVGEIRGYALLQGALQRGIQRGGDAFRLRVGGAQALGQQGRVHRRPQAARDNALDACVVDLRSCPRAAARHPRQQLVARLAGGVGRAVGTQSAWRLRQHGEQRSLRMRQPRGGLAEVGPTRRFHAFDGAAERRAFQVEGEDLALRQMRFQLHGAQRLAQLAQRCSRARSTQAGIEDPGHLHGQRRATRDDPPVAQHLAPGAQQRHGIDAGVLPEPAILVGQQRLHVQRRDPFRRGRIAPDALRIGERAQGAAIACQDHDAGIAPGRQRQREQQVEQQQGRQQGDAAPAQPGQQASCPAHSPACGRGRG